MSISIKNNSFISDPLLISETLANHEAFVSYNSSHDNAFLSYKAQTENLQINFEFPVGQPLVYILPITDQELSVAIRKNLRNASPGLDNIRAAILKNLHRDLPSIQPLELNSEPYSEKLLGIHLMKNLLGPPHQNSQMNLCPNCYKILITSLKLLLQLYISLNLSRLGYGTQCTI